MIHNPNAIDYSKGVKNINGRIIGNIIGCNVMTTKEAEAHLEQRRQPGGDLHTETIKKEQEEFFKNLKDYPKKSPNTQNH